MGMKYNRYNDSSGKIQKAASMLLSHSIPTINDRKVAVRVTNAVKSLYTINKNTQIADFSIVTPEQSKLFKPVNTAILNLIPEGDPDLTIYLVELSRTNEPDQQNITF